VPDPIGILLLGTTTMSTMKDEEEKRAGLKVTQSTGLKMKSKKAPRIYPQIELGHALT